MFRADCVEKQFNIFSNVGLMFSGKAKKRFDHSEGWHNIFRREVFSRIDEKEYKVLFNDSFGAPNASIRTLISMMILKEGHGWSDNQLFEQCHFNLLVRSAIGLVNLEDKAPVESTYYLLRKRIHEYCKTNGVDLIDRTFQAITGGQALDMMVCGKSIRMDSKLIGSNIAWLSRYELIHQTIGFFCRRAEAKRLTLLSAKERELVAAICKESGQKVVYRSTRDDIQLRLQELGLLMYKLISIFDSNSSESYELLCRVFGEQYEIENDLVKLRPKEEIDAQSVQSPHDPDCTYRKKEDQKVKGYSVNITETCDKGTLNLITDVQVEHAGTPDNSYVIPAVGSSVNVTGVGPENLNADGAYHSPENSIFCEIANINYYCNAVQGKQGRYDLQMVGEQLQVTDLSTGEIIPCITTKSGGWRIKTSEGTRYFSQEQIESCESRKQAESIPQEIKNIRNNVESTIFQLCFLTRNNKTRYRGMIKHKLWAIVRSLWVNFRRILKWMGGVRPIGFERIEMPSFLLTYQVLLIVLFTIILPLDSKNKNQAESLLVG